MQSLTNYVLARGIFSQGDSDERKSTDVEVCESSLT